MGILSKGIHQRYPGLLASTCVAFFDQVSELMENAECIWKLSAKTADVLSGMNRIVVDFLELRELATR